MRSLLDVSALLICLLVCLLLPWAASGLRLGFSCMPLECSLVASGLLLCCFWAALGHPRPSWGRLWIILAHFGSSWDHLGTILDLWSVLAHLGPSWGHNNWGHLGIILEYIGSSQGLLGSILGASWPLLANDPEKNLEKGRVWILGGSFRSANLAQSWPNK